MIIWIAVQETFTTLSLPLWEESTSALLMLSIGPACFDQRHISRCDMSRGLKYAWVVWAWLWRSDELPEKSMPRSSSSA